MAIQVENVDGKCNIKVSDELTIYTCGDYRDVLINQCDATQQVLLDVSDISEVDCCGLQLLLAFKHQQENSNSGLQFIGENIHLQEVLEQTQLTSLFDIYKGN